MKDWKRAFCSIPLPDVSGFDYPKMYTVSDIGHSLFYSFH